jgi:hypothetical protein
MVAGCADPLSCHQRHFHRCGRRSGSQHHERSPSATEAGEYYDSDYDEEEEAERGVEMPPVRSAPKGKKGGTSAKPAPPAV